MCTRCIRPRWKPVVVLLAAATVVACQDETAPTQPGLTPSFSLMGGGERPGPDPFPLEREFREIADEVDGFAGFFAEEDRLVVLATGPEASASARSAVAARLQDLRQGSPDDVARSIEVREAAYSFRALEAWRNLIFYDMGEQIPDWTFLDLDERNNRVFLGVPNEARLEEVRQTLTEAGVPAAALHIQVRQAPVMDIAQDSIDGRVRPMTGGLRTRTNASSGSGEPCTSGFMALYGSTEVVSTASHCSNAGGNGYMWNIGSALPNMHQNSTASGSHVGDEAFDPNPWSCSPTFWSCRRTDHVFYELDDSLSFSYGTIPRIVITGSVPWGVNGAGNGPKVIDDTNGPWEIIAEPTVFPTSTVLYKLGATTGLTSGNLMDHSCAAVPFPGPNTRVTCANTANYYSLGGDSGSPVFSWDGSSNEIRLFGTHFARDDPASGDSLRYYNTMTSIRQDFTAFTLVTFDPPLTVVTQGASPIPPDEECEWWATVTGGVPPYTSYVWSGVLSGTGPTLFGSLGQGQSGFLFVTVTDSEPTSVKDSLWVQVDGSAAGCEN